MSHSHHKKQCCHAKEQAGAPPVILSIAGSDSGGGAGIQTDIKTISVLGGFATTVIAALTAQNGAEVRGVMPIPPAFILEQLKTVEEGFPIAAAKTGMLSSADIIIALASHLEQRSYPLVVDPVCISESGARLLEESALAALVERLLPIADLITPNAHEAGFLSGVNVASVADVPVAIAKLQEMGAKAVLLKGGHMPEFEGTEYITDWLGILGQPLLALSHKRIDTVNSHGTGCALSAAIATGLGLGLSLEKAVQQAQEFLSATLATAYAPGLGAGPPNIMSWLSYKKHHKHHEHKKCCAHGQHDGHTLCKRE